MLNTLAAVVLVTATNRHGSIFPDAYGNERKENINHRSEVNTLADYVHNQNNNKILESNNYWLSAGLN